jgi:hypothetical protein
VYIYEFQRIQKTRSRPRISSVGDCFEIYSLAFINARINALIAPITPKMNDFPIDISKNDLLYKIYMGPAERALGHIQIS